MEELQFGVILKALRTERKLTQPQLAEKIGVSRAVISFWENGVYEPTATNIIKLAKFFDVSSDFLLGMDS